MTVNINKKDYECKIYGNYEYMVIKINESFNIYELIFFMNWQDFYESDPNHTFTISHFDDEEERFFYLLGCHPVVDDKIGEIRLYFDFIQGFNPRDSED